VSDDVARPTLRVIHGGEPTAEEIAALTAGLAVVAARSRQAQTRAVGSHWASHERALRKPLVPGPGAWRASAWPSR
jgi:hypothetical protein